MFDGCTFASRRVLRAPATRAEIIGVFQRACTMAMRRAEPGRLVGGAVVEQDGEGTIMLLGFAGAFEGGHWWDANMESGMVVLGQCFKKPRQLSG